MAAVSAATLALAAAAADSALAATVRVEETAGKRNTATLVFEAASGEQNQVTVTATTGTDRLAQLRVVDKGASLAAGAGCTGGGGPGVAATCTMHAPYPGDYEYCGKGCAFIKDGTPWDDFLAVDLGDGENSFDGSALSGTYTESYVEKVKSGGGEDRIATGNGHDEVESGAGYDEVRTGGGYDTIIATPQPDGPDLYDGGPEGGDRVDYSARSAPVIVAEGAGGAPGEEDKLLDVDFVVGGSGDDQLSAPAASSYYTLQGGPGNDTLTGGEGRDNLFGNAGEDVLRGMDGDDILYGGDDNDRLEGGAGNDGFIEKQQATEGDNLTRTGSTFALASGDDTADGGAGDDRMWLGPGNDRGEGGDGNDMVFGEDGDDFLQGGAGDDEVGGERGADKLEGGAGNDRVLSGRVTEFRYSSESRAPDGWRDEVDCGEGEDFTNANRWDLVSNCEHLRRTRVVKLRKLHRLPSGVAILPVDVAGSGVLSITGRGIRPVRIEIEAKLRVDKPAALPRLRPRGAALRKLQRRGKVTERLRLAFAPRGGISRSEPLTIKLYRQRPGR